MDPAQDIDAVLQLLEKWRKRVRMNQLVHYARAKELNLYNNWLGIIAAMVAAIVGTSIFATIQKDVALWARIAAGLTSFLGAILASFQTQFKFSERASQHHLVAAGYGSIHRLIEAAQALPPSSNDAAQKLLIDLEKRMDELPHQAPAVPQRLWNNTPMHLTGKDAKSEYA